MLLSPALFWMATIALVVLGSRGDVEPLLALGDALRSRGHAVRIVTHESLRPRVEGRGFGYMPVRPDFGARLHDPRVRAAMERGLVAMFVGFVPILREMKPELDTMADDILAGVRGADLVLFPKVYGCAAWYAARALGIPAVAFALQPVDPTGDFATLALPPRANLGRAANRMSHALAVHLLAWAPYRRGTNLMLARHFPGVRAPRRGPYAELRRKRVPTLYAFSEHVVPRPTDWGDELRITGYWWSSPSDWTPRRELARFLDAGEPPVYVGFGSMPAGSERSTHAVLGALRDAGRRGVLAGRWDGVDQALVDDGVVFPIGDVPHAWLFPRLAAIVHHAGAGTTAAALRASVPSVCVPFMVDQPFWGNRVQALGAGPAPVPLTSLTRERLAHALRSAVGEEGMKARCMDLSERLRAESGVTTACETVEAVLQRG